MSEQQQDQDVEIVGMGVQFPTPIKVPRKQIWAAMVDKMYNTENYLPVTNVKITDIVPGRHAYREMIFYGELLKENIYFNETLYEIRAALVDEDKIHINIYHPDTGILEYWQENSKGKRISWDAPKADVLQAMQKTKEKAEASE
jgi:hypothetical protein